MDKMKLLDGSCRPNDEVYSVYDYDAYTIQELLCEYYSRINKNAELTNKLIDVIEGSGGIQGPVGPQGIPGPKGDQGPRGEAGPQGQIGLQGPKGEPGAKGETGETGPRGDRGIQGERGKQGPGIRVLGKVETSVDLPRPPIHNDNKEGDCYVDNQKHIWVWPSIGGDWIDLGQFEGPTGERGPVGATGQNGPRGERGLPGEKGEPGPMGLTGPAGPVGPPGEQGPRGDQGEMGPVGPQGERGIGVPAYSATENGKILGVVEGNTKWIDAPAGGDKIKIVNSKNDFEDFDIERIKAGKKFMYNLYLNGKFVGDYAYSNNFKVGEIIFLFGNIKSGPLKGGKAFFTCKVNKIQGTGIDISAPYSEFYEKPAGGGSSSGGGNTYTFMTGRYWDDEYIKNYLRTDGYHIYEGDLTGNKEKIKADIKNIKVGDWIHLISKRSPNKVCDIYGLVSKTLDGDKFYINSPESYFTVSERKPD